MKILGLLSICLFISIYTLAQSPVILEKIVFTNSSDAEHLSKSIQLKITILNKDDVKLSISCDPTNSVEVSVNDLSHTVVKGLIVEKIISWYPFRHFVGKPIDTIFSKSDIDKIDGLVMQTIIARTSLNNVEKNDIKSVFRFNDTVSFYLELPKDTICNKYTKQQQHNLAFSTTGDFLSRLDSLINNSGNNEVKALSDRIKKLSALNDSLELNNILLSNHIEESVYKRDSLLLESNPDKGAIQRMNNGILSDSARLHRNAGMIALNEKAIERSVKRINVISPPAIAIYRDTVCSYKHVNIQEGRLYIDSLEATIKDGFLRILKFSFGDSLDIITNNGIKRVSRQEFGFSKRQEFSITLDLRSVSFSEFWLDKFFYLENKKSKNKYVFNLDNALKYRPPQDAGLIETFVPQRSRLFFSRNSTTILVPETDVNKILTLNLFTDIVGIEENKPNGLIQAEAKFHGSLQRKTKPGPLITLRFDVFNYFEVNFILSKIEEKRKFLELLTHQTPTDSFSYLHTFNLMQYQNLEFGAKFNLCKIITDIHEAHLCISVGTIKTGVRDSLVQVVNNENIITPRNISLWTAKYQLQGLYRLKAISRVGVDLSVSLTGLTLLSDKIRQSAGTYDEIDIRNNRFKPFSFTKNLIATYQAQIYYYANRDESQRLYARLALNKELGAKGNRFPVMQIGYSADINKFLQFK